MSLFGLAKEAWVRRRHLFYDRELDNAAGDRRRIKDNADKLGGAFTDLECRVNAIEEGLKNGKKHKH